MSIKILGCPNYLSRCVWVIMGEICWQYVPDMSPLLRKFTVWLEVKWSSILGNHISSISPLLLAFLLTFPLQSHSFLFSDFSVFFFCLVSLSKLAERWPIVPAWTHLHVQLDKEGKGIPTGEWENGLIHRPGPCATVPTVLAAVGAVRSPTDAQ